MKINNEMSSTPKRFLVTGASRGIGWAISKALVDAGHEVVGLARTFDEKSQTLPRFSGEVLDLANLAALPEALEQLRKRYSPFDGIVGNAGMGRFGCLEEFSFAQIQSLMNLNFTANAILAKIFLPDLKKRSSGDLIFIGSEAALIGTQRGSIYCASKFALRGFCQALQAECSKSGVRVSIIHPGMVKTDFFEELSFTHGDLPENFLEPEDVADAVQLILNARPGTAFQEIILNPLKKVIQTKREKD